MLGPRDDFLTWDEYYMAKAMLTGMRSKDPNTRVGACIVDDKNKPVGSGYNGFPSTIDNNSLPWDRVGDPLDTKYMYMCHAEANAIDNSNCDYERMSRSRIYSTLFPCHDCAKRIIQNGIKEIVYLSDKYHNTDSSIAARKLFELAGVKTRQLIFNKPKVITIKLKNE